MILTKASAAVTFEVTVTLQRAVTGAADRILLGGQDQGSGFAITDSRALTAGHVVRAAATMVGRRNDDAARPP